MEEWKDIKGFEGFYQVSNEGRIRSLDRIDTRKNGDKIHYKGKIIKQAENSKGYKRVCLKKNNNSSVVFVHRLVAFHFVKNQDESKNTIVNHLDSNFRNNKADNLEWTTLKGNTQHALLKGRFKRIPQWLENLHKSQEKTYRPVVAYDPKTNEIVAEYKSVNESRKDGYQPSCVCVCCKNKRKLHKGLIWKYKGV